MENIETWKFLAGLGFFLYGMNQLEKVLKSVSGRPLKLFLKRNTRSLLKSIIGGAIVTGIVQSSSVVSLIVLAFVESGIITFRNALGVILGTNLGTTLDSWIVASIGFKIDILSYSLPIIAITAIGMFFFEKKRKLYHLFAVFFALGILFLGIGFMKEGALSLVKEFDLKSYTNYGTFAFVIIGFILTTIIQSSSATVAITLTAIYTGILTFPQAAAIVIGSEVGTTIKILLWGIKGSSDKKRVAYANFFYNIFTTVIAYIFLQWIIYFVVNILEISDPLIGLVAFQTTINIISIILFVPFLNIFASWLESKFITDSRSNNSYISHNLPTLPMLAADAMKNEAKTILKKTIAFNKNILCFEQAIPEGFIENIKSFTQTYVNIEEEYNRLKQTEGDILGYYSNIHKNNLGKDDVALMLQYVNAARQSVFAAKAIKDIHHNLNEFNASANDIIHQQCMVINNEWAEFDTLLNQFIDITDKGKLGQQVEAALKNAISIEEKHRLETIAQLKNNQLSEIEASTLMNVHRELLACKKSILLAINYLEE